MQTQAPFQGTASGGINPAGTIEGEYLDNGGVAHGFMRAANGTITTFDAPGAGTAPGPGTFNGNINPAGGVEATYIDSTDALHGYLFAKDGTLTTFDVPGAGQGTQSIATTRSAQSHDGTLIRVTGLTVSCGPRKPTAE